MLYGQMVEEIMDPKIQCNSSRSQSQEFKGEEVDSKSSSRTGIIAINAGTTKTLSRDLPR